MSKIGEELFRQRGIDRDMFCAKCGYNLRTRPRIGRCPECGNDYDARPLGTYGILQAESVTFPFDLCLATGVCGIIAACCLVHALLEQKWWSYLIEVTFIVIFVGLFRATRRRIGEFIRHRSAVSHARRQSEDHES
jgi:hypothetical protein